MYKKARVISLAAVSAVTASLFITTSIAYAWVGPGNGTVAPNNNVAAPVNVSGTAQSKSGVLTVGGLGVTGNILVSALAYLNWGSTAGSSGYGLRDNNGLLEYKHATGTWTMLGTGGSTGSSGQWTTNGTAIYNSNSGSVGIGTGTPAAKFDIYGVGSNSSTLDLTNAHGQYYLRMLRSGAAVVDIYKNTGGYLVLNSYATASTLAGFQFNANMYVPATVGIGTLPTTRPLEVGGSTSGDYIARFVSTGTHGAMGQGTQFGLVGNVTGAAGGQAGVLGSALNASGHGVIGYGPSTGSTYYGVYGSAGSYYGALGRADGYSFVGMGTLYNNGSVIQVGGGANTFSGNVTAPAFLYSSDARLKNVSGPIQNALAKVRSLTGVAFTWKSGDKKGKEDIGVIAQDVQKVAPEAVQVDSKGMLTVDYPRLTPLLINAIKEQQVQIDELKAQIRELQNK